MVVEILNKAYDEVIMGTTAQHIIKSFEEHIDDLAHKIGRCRPLHLAYKVLTHSLCDLAVPRLTTFGMFYAMATLLFQVGSFLRNNTVFKS